MLPLPWSLRWDYQTYMIDPTKDLSCLCSALQPVATALSGSSPSTQPSYLAALIAAPPPDVASVSFVTGLATIGKVTLSG